MGRASGGEQTPDANASVTGRVTSGDADHPASSVPVGDAFASLTGMIDRDRMPVADASVRRAPFASSQRSVASGGSSRSRAAIPARSPLAARRFAS